MVSGVPVVPALYGEEPALMGRRLFADHLPK